MCWRPHPSTEVMPFCLCVEVSCSCLENPRDGGAWWAAIYGVAQSWTQLKRLSSSRDKELLLGQLLLLYTAETGLVIILCFQINFFFFVENSYWMKHKLESRLQGEITITLDMQMTPPLWQKAKRN